MNGRRAGEVHPVAGYGRSGPVVAGDVADDASTATLVTRGRQERAA